MTINYRWQLITNDCGRLQPAAIGIGLKAKLHRLPCADSAIPANTGCRVGVGAADIGIPRTGEARIAAVLPARAPAGFAAGAGIGDANRAGKP